MHALRAYLFNSPRGLRVHNVKVEFDSRSREQSGSTREWAGGVGCHALWWSWQCCDLLTKQTRTRLRCSLGKHWRQLLWWMPRGVGLFHDCSMGVKSIDDIKDVPHGREPFLRELLL